MSDYLKPLCVPNELLLQGKKIYIWGNDEDASRLFTQLCVFSIKISGFINAEWRGTTLWHRPVVALDDVNLADSVICIPNAEVLLGGGMQKQALCIHPIILNPEFDKTQAVIYGAGRSGRQVLHFLQAVGIEVLCFIDSDREKAGSRIENILVEEISYLEKLPESVYVVEAGYFYKEIDKVVSKYIGSKKRFFREKPLEGRKIDIDIDFDKIIRIWTIQGLEQFKGISRYYLYSASSGVIEKYQAVFSLMDIKIDEVTENSDGVGKSVVELLYEENYLILIEGKVDEAMKLGQKLETLGMREGIEYTWLHDPVFCGHNLSRNQVMDLNLGYTYIMDKKYPGFQVLGENNDLDCKIVILGGSTTDAESYQFKSWVDFLYERCAGYDVSIFNGGIAGYTSTQEVIKLLRDVINLSPDMVIVYDGENDAEHNYNHKPYSFPYLKKVFVTAAGQSKSLNFRGDILGKDERESFDIWVSNMEIMYEITQSRGIRFFGFLQPMLCSKKDSFLTLREKSIIKYISLLNKEYASDAGRYRSLAKEQKIEEMYDYMYDLSDIFDEKDVYLDHCHVSEEGNQIIADKIWEKVKGCIIENSKRKKIDPRGQEGLTADK